MIMLIFPEISILFWLWEGLLGFCIAAPSGTEGESFRGQASRVRGVRAQSFLVQGMQAGGDGMLPYYSVRKPVKQKSHQIFLNGKGNGEMK